MTAWELLESGPLDRVPHNTPKVFALGEDCRFRLPFGEHARGNHPDVAARRMVFQELLSLTPPVLRPEGRPEFVLKLQASQVFENRGQARENTVVEGRRSDDYRL